MTIRKEPLTPALTEILLSFSRDWEQENSTFGYRANTPDDLNGRSIYMAWQEGTPLGYLFGHTVTQDRASSAIPRGSRCFEVEELYVRPGHRSRGVGGALFQFLENDLDEDISFLTLTTATRNHRAILHFYIEEMDMTFWSARLFKQRQP